MPAFRGFRKLGSADSSPGGVATQPRIWPEWPDCRIRRYDKREARREKPMPKSQLLYAQVFAFFAGFFVCAALSQVVRHPSNTLWLDFSVLSVVFVLWSRQYAGKLKRNLPQSNP